LIVQAGTVSTRSRGEQPSFNVLRMQRPDIELTRYSWNDEAGAFTAAATGQYKHGARGWTTIAACS